MMSNFEACHSFELWNLKNVMVAVDWNTVIMLTARLIRTRNNLSWKCRRHVGTCLHDADNVG